MTFTVRLLLLIKCSLVALDIFTVIANPEGKITGGYEASPHSHPYLVSIQFRFLWMRLHFCGGSLLTKQWVLSAGHCITEIKTGFTKWLPIYAVAGLHSVEHYKNTGQAIKITKRIPHPLFEGGVASNDIGLFKTETPFTYTTYIKPVVLPKNDNYGGDPLRLAGWGALRTTKLIPDLPSILQEINVTIMPYEECYQALDLGLNGEYNPLEKESHICTGPISGGIAACDGDSGGPLIAYIPHFMSQNNGTKEIATAGQNANYDKNNQINIENQELNKTENKRNEDNVIPVVVGIVSWSVSPCGIKGAPTVYTKVYNYIDFINHYIINEDNVQSFGIIKTK